MDDVYLIAEIGQNHNGSVEIAKALIDLAATPIYHEGKPLKGIDAVKLQKRDLRHELTWEGAHAPYDGPNSFGATYGQHRAALELSAEEHRQLYKYATAKGLDFIETACNPGAVRDLQQAILPDRWKVASRDLRNGPLLKAIAMTNQPIILSTGMHTHNDVRQAINDIQLAGHKNRIDLLYCVSRYPAPYDYLSLCEMQDLARNFAYLDVGFSDHTTGILAPAIAAAMGAKLIEKHITLHRGMRGSDHQGAMGPEGVARFVRDVRNVRLMQQDNSAERQLAEGFTFAKVGRVLCTKRTIGLGEEIRETDLVCLSPPAVGAVTWDERALFVGKVTTQAIDARTPLTSEMVE